MKTLLYSVAAQEDNLGDAVIRREVLTWLLPIEAQVQLFAGSMSASYLTMFHRTERVAWHRSAVSWTSAAVRACARGSVALVYAPGPRLAPRGVSPAAHAVFKALIPLAVLARRGKVVTVGGAVSGSDSVALQVQRYIARRSEFVGLRDLGSVARIGGTATLMPDVGFARATPQRAVPATPTLVISLRSDRDPDLDVLRKLVTSAERAGLRPMTVTQVRRDDQLLRNLSRELKIDHLGWTNQSHLEQWDRVQGAYRQAAAVFSNRLHACIFAASHGAVVLNAEATSGGKISETLSSVLPPELCKPTELHQVESSHLSDLLDRRTTTVQAVQQASRVLGHVQLALLKRLSPETSR